MAALCVSSMAVLGLACSVDLAKLRGPAAAVPDGGADTGEASAFADAATIADVLPAPQDLPGDAKPDHGGDDLPRVEPDTHGSDASATIRDVPLADEVGIDLEGGGDATATGDDAGPAEDSVGEDSGAGDGRETGEAGSVPSDTGEAEGGAGAGGNQGTGGTDNGAGGTGGVGGSSGAGGSGGVAGTGGAAVDPDLVLWYKFDESTGTVASDSSTSGLDGKLAATGGSATFSSESQVGTHALRLSPGSSSSSQTGGYVTTPAPTSLAPSAITIALWVKLASAASDQNWARLFDFGTGPGASDPYLYMTSRASDTSNPRFGITNIGRGVGGVQRLDAPSPLTANVWHHIAIVLPAGTTYTGSLYIDGEVVATNNAMTVHPADVGVTTDNWLGRSPSSADPYLSAWLDDFRVYKRALSASEIAGLMALR